LDKKDYQNIKSKLKEVENLSKIFLKDAEDEIKKLLDGV